MILFKEDWLKYPEAIVHLQTTNKTALKLATIYKRMGIENYAFILALHNPELANVDPYSEDLTFDQQVMIAEELAVNPWYFFREIARVAAKGSIEPVQFRLNRANIASYWLFFNHITGYLIQPRQTGKSLSYDELYIYLLEYGCTNTPIEVVTKDNGLRVANVERIKEILDILPPWLNLRDKKDSNNMENISVLANKNILNFHVSQKSVAGATNLGRGLTSPIVGIDEIAHNANMEISLPVILAAMSAARDNAKVSGLPYGAMFYTTAGFLDSKAGKFAYSVYNKAARWTEHMLDCRNQTELEDLVDKNITGVNRVVLVEFSHRELGFTDDWLRRKIAEAMSDGANAAADFLMLWQSGSMTSALSKSVIKALEESRRSPAHVEIAPQGFIIDWHVSEDEVKHYETTSFVIGLDTSDAIGNDGIGLIGRDVKTGKVICKGSYNLTNLTLFGDFVFWFMMKYSKAVLIIERRSSAAGILDQLEMQFTAVNENIFKRVFNWVVDKHVENKSDFEDLENTHMRYMGDFYVRHKKKFGFATSGGGTTSRSILYGETLTDSLSVTAEHTYDKDLIHQLVNLEKKNGRIDHKHDDNDDLVVAALLVWHLLTKGKNLQYYGINPALVLSNVVITDDSMKKDKDAKDKLDKKRAVVEEITDILESMETSANEKDFMTKTLRMRMLKGLLDGVTVLSMNIEARYKEIVKNMRTKRRPTKNYW